MEPRIQYAKTSDGLSIAYWVCGEGPPLVYIPNIIWSHAQLEWQFPEISAWYQRLAAHRTLVRLDPRGTGLSDHAVEEYSLEALERDLGAVVDRLGLQEFAIFASINAVPLAIAFAAKHPERITHLILWCYAPNLDLPGSRYQSLRALQPFMDKDWETYTEVRAGLEFGWSAGELAHRYAALLRQCTTPEMAARAYPVVEALDVTPYLRDIRSQTLVVHRQDLYFWDVEAARSLTAQIEGARLAVLEGVASAPFLGDIDALERTIDGFLSPGADGSQGPMLPSGTAIILYADIVDSTALSEQLGNTTFRERSRQLEGRLRQVIEKRGGSTVRGRTLGDGVLATFPSAGEAIAAARDCADAGKDLELELHLGVHAGDVIREDGNVYGQAVSVTSRISALSAPNELLVSSTVRDLARASIDVSFEERGAHELKGVSDPVRLYEVRWRAEGSP